MDKITTIEGDLNARDLRVTIVAARFNEFIVESLIKGAIHCLKQHGATDSAIELIRVPGIGSSTLQTILGSEHNRRTQDDCRWKCVDDSRFTRCFRLCIL